MQANARPPRAAPSKFSRNLLLTAPLVFAAHVAEEAPGFVAWFNAHVARGITSPLFWSVNWTGVFITAIVVTLEWAGGTTATAILVVAWLSGVMFANALFHVAGALADRAYMPGVVTALLLYLPFYSTIVTRMVRSRRLSLRQATTAAIFGALPMLIHGYLIVFRGSRLF